MVSLETKRTQAAYFPPRNFGYLAGNIVDQNVFLWGVNQITDDVVVEVYRIDRIKAGYSFTISKTGGLNFVHGVAYDSIVCFSNSDIASVFHMGHELPSTYQFTVTQSFLVENLQQETA